MKKFSKEYNEKFLNIMTERWYARLILDRAYQVFEGIQDKDLEDDDTHLNRLDYCFDEAYKEISKWMEDGH